MAASKRSKDADRQLGSVVRVPKAAEIVSSKLRSLIIRNELTEGSSLPSEANLMAQFGVSRPTLREAIRILESEGLVSINRGAKGGTVIHRPNLSVLTRYLGNVLQVEGTTIGEIYRVHAFLEAPAARLVAERNDPEVVEELRLCLDEARQHLDNDSLFGLDTARFRNALVKRSGIPTLALLASILNDLLESSWSSLTVKAGREVDNRRAKQRGIKSMKTLIDFIAAGDGASAEDHWRQHTRTAEATMRKWLDVTRVIDVVEG